MNDVILQPYFRFGYLNTFTELRYLRGDYYRKALGEDSSVSASILINVPSFKLRDYWRLLSFSRLTLQLDE